MMGNGKLGSDLLLPVARWLFLLYVASLPLVQPFGQRFRGYLFVYSDLIFAAAAGAWVLAVIRGKDRSRGHSLFKWIGIFVVAMTISAAASEDPGRSFLKLLGVIYLAAIAVVSFNLAGDGQFFKFTIFAWLAGTGITVFGAFLGVGGFYAGFDSTATNRFLFHFGSLPVGNYPRIDSFFDNANMMANYLNVSVVLALAVGAAGWIEERKSFVFALLILVASFFTFSAGLGGIILSVALFLAFGKFRERKLVRTAALLGGGVVAILAFASTLVSPINRENQYTLTVPVINVRFEPSVRVVIWKNVLERGSEFPILGRGTGSDAADVRYLAVSGQTQVLRDAHQAWLNIFGQAGLIGVLAFGLLCWGMLRVCSFALNSGSDAEWIRMGLSAAFIGAFLFQNLFGSFEDARHLWVLIGLLPASETLTKARHVPTL